MAFAASLAGLLPRAEAQSARAALVVRGADVDAVRVTEALRGALSALEHEVLSEDAVQAAVAFASPSDDEALRVALSIDMLIVVETRAADGGDVFVALSQLVQGDRRQHFGRVRREEVGAFAARQLVEWIRRAPLAVRTAAPGSHDAARVPVAVAPIFAEPTHPGSPTREPADPSAPVPGSSWVLAGVMLLLLGVAAYALTPSISAGVLCPRNYPCDDYIGLGFVPFAGAWLVLGNPPITDPWDEGEQAFLHLVGISQVILLPLSTILLIVGSTQVRRSMNAMDEVSLEVAPTLGGGAELRLRGSF